MNPSYSGVLGFPPSRRKRRWPRRLLWTLIILLVLAVVAIAVGVLWLRSAENTALPVLDGDVHINTSSGGLASAVTVRRDGHGVPHIEAASQDDLFVAQGYVTAQDRLWQMDASRRNANGELAEILGSSLVKHDKMQRVLQLGVTGKRIYANLNSADRTRLDDYARGVNLFIDEHAESLPAEFRLLHYRPQPWSGADSLTIGVEMAQMLDTHWDSKLVREELSADLHNPKLEADLYPVGSWRDHPPTGTMIDWSQQHPAPAGTADDDDDDRSQASVSAAGSMKGTGFSPYIDAGDSSRALAPEGMHYTGAPFPRGLKPPSPLKYSRYGLKPVPFMQPEFPTRLKPRPFREDSTAAIEDFSALRATLGLPSCADCVPGSNNWVVSGAHTASGKPLLANDMHLPLTEPNVWYMADLSAPGFHVAGVTLPGVPFVIAGHNEHVAWGFTALYADVQDLYLEKLDGNGNFQDHAGNWKPLAVDHEVIKVRGGKDVVLDVQSTDHGPLLNPLFKKEIHPFSLKWTLFDSTLNGLPLYEVNTAANWSEFSAALSTWCWPTLNVVYSDDQQHIAYHAVGRIPQRPGGLSGVPVQASDSKHEWQGYINFDKLPNSFDPPSGFLATANARVTSESFPEPLSLEWETPYRIQRIYKALQGRDKLTPKDMITVQTDIYSEVDQEIGHRLAYAIDHTPGSDDRLRKAADLMRSWDGRLTTDSAAASIVVKARYAFWPLILKPKLGKDADDYTWADSNFAEEEIIMHGNADWLPTTYKNWDALLTDAVRMGMKDGKAPGDVTLWKYGSWHVVDIEHPLASFLPFIGRIAGTGEQPLSGDTTTVKQVGRDFGPSQRFTMDWSNIDGSTEDIVLGESGDPYSAYFRDQWSDYYGGTTFALPFTQPAVAAQTQHTLRLLP
jgi:penicillin G amidase